MLRENEERLTDSTPGKICKRANQSLASQERETVRQVVQGLGQRVGDVRSRGQHAVHRHGVGRAHEWLYCAAHLHQAAEQGETYASVHQGAGQEAHDEPHYGGAGICRLD